eukprot:2040677-Ditylum_brightwellii.AAC.1
MESCISGNWSLRSNGLTQAPLHLKSSWMCVHLEEAELQKPLKKKIARAEKEHDEDGKKKHQDNSSHVMRDVTVWDIIIKAGNFL